MLRSKRVSLGPHETALLFELEARDRSIFTLGQAAEILRISRPRATDILYRLRKKGRILEVRKGAYVLVPGRAGPQGHWTESIYRILDEILRDGYYVGFWTAMNYWGLTEQVPRLVHVATANRRRGFEFQGQEVRFVTLHPRRFFGVTVKPLNPGRFRISDREKTLLDGLFLPRYSGGVPEVAKGIWEARKDLDWTRLEEYVVRLGVDAVARRLGFLLETLRIDVPLRRRLRPTGAGFRWLDPSGPQTRLFYSERWGLIVNVDPSEMLEE